jgi:hypothetical protein
MKGSSVRAKKGKAMEDRWAKLEEIVRRVVREEVASLKKTKTQISFEKGRWVIGTDEMQMFREAYPAVDIDKELREAAVWIVTHPNEAPKSKWGAFLNTWFKKHQFQTSLAQIPRKTETPKKLCAYCDTVAAGQVGGIWACDPHWQKAMDRDPVPHMRGVVAKPVAGA